MDYSTLPDRIARIENLKAFAEASGLHRRTLQRVRDREGSPSLKTCSEIVAAIQLHKPKMRRQA
jgi:DNA-binding phage protein